MKLLCNLPLECFQAREELGDLVTFGPADRMWVDGVKYPFDVCFDPSEGSIHELLALLPAGFSPDVLLLYWPDQEPLPADLEQSPIPVVGVLSDYNLSLPWVSGLWPFFDVLLVDRPGVELFSRLPFADVRYFCQFTFKAPVHRLYEGVSRDLDVAFAGNLNPIVQGARAPFIERLRSLGAKGLRIEVAEGIFGADYGRFLNRARIGFNRSIRGEMNLRAFEVPACGALLLIEEENLELREFFTPGEECVLYGEDDFEEVVCHYTNDEAARARIARAGHERVQTFAMSRRLEALGELLAIPGPGRPPSTALDRALGRGTAMLNSWAEGNGALRCLVEATRLGPADPRALNALALALLRRSGGTEALRAAELLRRACALAPGYVPAALNLASLLRSGGQPQEAARLDDELERRLEQGPSLSDLDGPVLPLGYSARAIEVARATGAAVRAGHTEGLLDAWRPRTPASV